MRAKVWRYPGQAGWHFVTLPKTHADAIKRFYVGKAKGWGSLPVSVTLGRTTWRTSIFPDRQSGSYLLPLKAEIRKAAKIAAGDAISFTLEMRV
jgi:hypothetical protein